MTPDFTPQAISQALSGNWKEAVKLNLEILKKNPKDIDTLNRLGRAYLETGAKTKAADIYKKVLSLDKFNSIATKNFALLKIFKVNHSTSTTHRPATPIPAFLEEPGVTKTVSLIRLGDPKITSHLHPGDSVTITAREHTVSVVSLSGEYLGRLPDDLASRLRTFLKSGSTYMAWIRSLDPQNIKVFIREATRGPKFRHVLPFPPTEKLTYAAFTPPELVHEEKPDVSATEEQEDRPPLEEEPLDSV